MTQIQVSFDEETLRKVLLGDKGAEVLLEKVMNEILQAEMTEHLGAGNLRFPSLENRPMIDEDTGTARMRGSSLRGSAN